MKPRCCPNTPTRKIARSVHEEARDVARRDQASDQYEQSRKQRKKVEMLFAHLKRILRLDRLRLRGLVRRLRRVHPGGHSAEPATPGKPAGQGPPPITAYLRLLEAQMSDQGADEPPKLVRRR